MEENAGQGNFYDVDGLPLISATVFSRFSTVRQLPREESELLARLILSEIIVTLSVTLPAPPEESEPLGIRVMRYLNDHLTEKIKLSELAQHFFVSKYYICRAFRMQNGVSILQYLTEKRVYLARQLMEQGRTAFSAGMQAGFGDYSSFYRAYTRVIGHAPTASDAPPKNDLTPTEKEDRLEED